MGAYRTVVVGTDGSDSSMRAVEKAAQIAGADAKLIVASAYLPQHEDARAADVLRDESYKVSGTAPIYAILRDAKDRAHAAGAKNIDERPIVGAPVDALVHLAEEEQADLLVVGNVGLSTIAGRLLGSVPANVSRRAKTDVSDRAHDDVVPVSSGSRCPQDRGTQQVRRAAGYQPRSRHSLRWGRSSPNTVSSPWPG